MERPSVIRWASPSRPIWSVVNRESLGGGPVILVLVRFDCSRMYGDTLCFAPDGW
jgi:hypothetical protein